MAKLTLSQVKQKSDFRLSKVNPIIRDAAYKLIEIAYNKGINIRIVQGLRTMEEQAAIYAQGRTKPGPIVSGAKPGYSFHNFGLAIDFCLMSEDGTKVFWDTRRDDNENRKSDWFEVAAEAKKLGFEWGGDWTSFVDYPHLQMTFGLTTAQLRAGAKPPTKLTEKPKPAPAPAPVKAKTHKVKSGDTLWEIARDNKLTVAKLKSLNGLKSDTIKLGQVLKLEEAKKPVEVSSGAVVPYPGKPLSKGSKGKDVERIQRAVNVKVDGDFGIATEKAVKAYQKRKGLVEDGIVGLKTWNTLF